MIEGLEALRDIHLPPRPEIWPPAPGWWLVLAAAAIAGLLAKPTLKRLERFTERRQTIRRFNALASRSSEPGAAAELSRLLRDVAVRRHGHREAAGVTGEAWLAFLDATSPEGSTGFFDDPARRLLDIPYRPAHDVDCAALVDSVRPWLEHNA